MKLRFLGTGTSTGNPEIGCHCEVCRSQDPKDNRLRASVLIQSHGKNILIDCGPDFRMQMLETLKYQPQINRLDAVLLSHEHYDHVGGIDDLRPFCKHAAVNIYGESSLTATIKERMPYAFGENKYPGTPSINLHAIDLNPFVVEGIEIKPIRIMHAKLPIMGYRIGALAYLTDVKTIPEESFALLENLDVLIIDALRPQAHISHQTIDEALAHIERIKPQKAYLIHMSHDFGLHALMEKRMPQNVFVAYDGLELTIAEALSTH